MLSDLHASQINELMQEINFYLTCAHKIKFMQHEVISCLLHAILLACESRHVQEEKESYALTREIFTCSVNPADNE
jgi:hypothetical protein